MNKYHRQTTVYVCNDMFMFNNLFMCNNNIIYVLRIQAYNKRCLTAEQEHGNSVVSTFNKYHRHWKINQLTNAIFTATPHETDAVSAVSSIYIWSKNFSHSVNEKSEAKMAAIDVQ
jgi:hypothetical protein